MRYNGILGRINAAVKQNKGLPGTYAISLEGKLLFGFADEGSKDYLKAARELKEKGYKGRNFIYQSVLDPDKTYIFSAA